MLYCSCTKNIVESSVSPTSLTDRGRDNLFMLKPVCLLCSYPHGASAQEEEDLCVFGVTIMSADFTTALEALQEAHSQAIGAPKVGLICDNVR